MRDEVSAYQVFVVCSVVVLLIFTCSVEAEESKSSFRQLINCQEHWAKKDEVPVYSAPDETSETVSKLPAQEKVCVIGERGEFYILDWRNQSAINERRGASAEKEADREIAYVRKVDVIVAAPEDPDLWSRAKRQMNRVGYGMVPEDIYGPFRPVIDMFRSPTECLAGEEICKKVEQDLQKKETEVPNE